MHNILIRPLITEKMTNITATHNKHGFIVNPKANKVEISIVNDMSNLQITVSDDGVGFDLAELNVETIQDIDSQDFQFSEDTRGLGLLGMQERIELLGGDLEIDTAPGSGTQINIRVPIQERSLVYD